MTKKPYEYTAEGSGAAQVGQKLPLGGDGLVRPPINSVWAPLWVLNHYTGIFDTDP